MRTTMIQKAEQIFSPLKFSDPAKTKVQLEAFAMWKRNGYRGTVEMATGTGKSQLGLMATVLNRGSTLIVVPTVHLQQQWVGLLTTVFGADKIGLVGDGFDDIDKPVVIGVINSIRDRILKKDLLIIDEVHRVASSENIKFLRNGMFGQILGLTATLDRQDGRHEFLKKYAPIVYEFSQEDALDNRLISDFSLENRPVELTGTEKKELIDIETRLAPLMKHFQGERSVMYYLNPAIQSPKKFVAMRAVKLISQRRKLLLSSDNKIAETVNIIVDSPNEKTIVFTEFIETAERIFELLKLNGVEPRIYHSKLRSKERRLTLEEFGKGTFNILITVKALDEGMDVPDLSRGIIVAGTSVNRQQIQRFGRVTRKAEGKVATIIQLYHPRTKDENWLLKRSGD